MAKYKYLKYLMAKYKKIENVFCIFSGIKIKTARFFKNMVVDNYVLPKEFHSWHDIVSFSTVLNDYDSRWGTILNQ